MPLPEKTIPIIVFIVFGTIELLIGLYFIWYHDRQIRHEKKEQKKNYKSPEKMIDEFQAKNILPTKDDIDKLFDK